MIGTDVANERQGSCAELVLVSTSGTKWDNSNDPNNYKKFIGKVGNAVHSINNTLLIIVEAIQRFEGHDTNWGGNLRAVKDYPIVLNTPNKVVYSPHEYGRPSRNHGGFAVPRLLLRVFGLITFMMTKQTCRDFADFFTQFFINSGPNGLAEISSTF
jgi:hypothetical protein